MSKSRQMRVSEDQYNILSKLSEEFGVSRSEMLASVINIIKALADNKATAVKIVCKKGKEKELLLTLNLGQLDED